MKKVFLAGAMLVMAGAARAEDVTVKVTDGEQQAFSNLPTAMDQCVAGMAMRTDPNVCRLVAQFVTEFGAKVKAAAPPKAEPAK